jgi:death-on-curing protein
MQTFDGRLLHRTIPEQAAVLAGAIVVNHPFEQGNKRTAFAAMQTFLAVNGYILIANSGESSDFICGLARGEIEAAAAVEWVEVRAELLR